MARGRSQIFVFIGKFTMIVVNINRTFGFASYPAADGGISNAYLFETVNKFYTGPRWLAWFILPFRWRKVSKSRSLPVRGIHIREKTALARIPRAILEGINFLIRVCHS